MPIVRLADEVASRIAAGEVVERPASVLKELVENSLDAGASRIGVEVSGGGRSLLRVSDDGGGMPPEDCRAAFGRHATSKISALEDLDFLSTFGFRGEALFAIAAVSRVALSSCTPGAGSGRRVELEAGRILRDHHAPPVPGTVVEVRDLFFNTPARLKFLRSEETEKAACARVVEEAALANPRVSFSLRTSPRACVEYPPGRGESGRALALGRLKDILGPEFAEGLLCAEEEGPALRLRAFVSRPDSLVGSRQLQYVFVNRRPVACRTLQQALYRAYEPFRTGGRHPAAVLFADVPPAEVDVNVHPRKREVRFRQERRVFEFVVSSLSKALLESRGIGTLDRPRPAVLEVREPTADFRRPEPAVQAVMEFEPAPPSWKGPLRFLGQIERAYLVFDAGGGLLVVDQHAAQERVLFERYLKALESGSPPSQRLMLPLPVELPASEVLRLLERRGRLSEAGFRVERFGKTAVQVTEVPEAFACASAADISDLVHRALDHFVSPRASQADARRDAAAAIACKAAVKAHDPLSEPEALALMRDLSLCADATRCPHGRPAMLDIGRAELARRFGRPGPPPSPSQ